MGAEYKQICYYREYGDGSGNECTVKVCESSLIIEYRESKVTIYDEDVLWFVENIISATNELNLLTNNPPEPPKDNAKLTKG